MNNNSDKRKDDNTVANEHGSGMEASDNSDSAEQSIYASCRFHSSVNKQT